MPKPKLLAVLAHPDDESLGVGSTLAKYAAEGVDVLLLTAARGESGRYRGFRPGDQPHPGAGAGNKAKRIEEYVETSAHRHSRDRAVSRAGPLPERRLFSSCAHTYNRARLRDLSFTPSLAGQTAWELSSPYRTFPAAPGISRLSPSL